VRPFSDDVIFSWRRSFHRIHTELGRSIEASDPDVHDRKSQEGPYVGPVLSRGPSEIDFIIVLEVDTVTLKLIAWVKEVQSD